jgi:hypothetical protein
MRRYVLVSGINYMGRKNKKFLYFSSKITEMRITVNILIIKNFNSIPNIFCLR